MIIESIERVSNPYDYSKEYLLYINPTRRKFSHLVNNKIAIRGLVLTDGQTVVFGDAAECEHDAMKENLIYDLGFNEAHVENSYELLITNIGSKEDSSYNTSVTIDDFKIYYRDAELGGTPFDDLVRMNFGLRSVLGKLSENEKQLYVQNILEQDLMEASVKQRITAIAASIGLAASHAVPLTMVSSGDTRVQQIDTPIVIDPDTFERWMTTQSHDEIEYKSMEAAEEQYDFDELLETDDFLYLALTMWGEARSHGETGMRAVGHVIVNRAIVGANMWGGSEIRNVATHPYQFSCWNQNDPNRERMLNVHRLVPQSPDGQAWKLAQAIAVQILTGNSNDPTHGATMYHTTEVQPSWSRSSRHRQVANVANHVFYVDTRWS